MQLDIHLRNLEDEKTRVTAFLQTHIEDFTADPESEPSRKRQEYEKILKQRDDLLKDIENIVKTIGEKQREI